MAVSPTASTNHEDVARPDQLLHVKCTRARFRRTNEPVEGGHRFRHWSVTVGEWAQRDSLSGVSDSGVSDSGVRTVEDSETYKERHDETA